MVNLTISNAPANEELVKRYARWLFAQADDDCEKITLGRSAGQARRIVN